MPVAYVTGGDIDAGDSAGTSGTARSTRDPVFPYHISIMFYRRHETGEAIGPHLLAGERVLWSGQPNRRAIFHREDLYLVPFSVVWNAFVIYFAGGLIGKWGPPVAGGPEWLNLPIKLFFVLVGQYFLWVRFFESDLEKARTHYAVTDRRVLIVQNFRTPRVMTVFLDTLPLLVLEGRPGRNGTLRFTPKDHLQRKGWEYSATMSEMTYKRRPMLVDIDDAEAVYRLIAGLRDTAQAGGRRAGPQTGPSGN